MPAIETFPDHVRRHLVHVYAALRECIKDELEYDREPDFPPLEEDTLLLLWDTIYTQLTQLMFAAHDGEAVGIEAEIEVSRALWRQAAERWR